MSLKTSSDTTAKSSVVDMCIIALFTAVIAIMAQLSIPMPMGVPMTMQTFAITLAAIILGAKRSTISTVIYLLLGMVGVPVLANFSAGLDKFVGPTGGFLLSFPIMAFIIGWGADHKDAFPGAFIVMLIAGTVVNYIGGIAMFCILTGNSVAVGFTACVLPFIPTAILKAILAVLIGFPVRKRIQGVMA